MVAAIVAIPKVAGRYVEPVGQPRELALLLGLCKLLLLLAEFLEDLSSVVLADQAGHVISEPLPADLLQLVFSVRAVELEQVIF